jgi:hypothetical protein
VLQQTEVGDLLGFVVLSGCRMGAARGLLWDWARRQAW